MSNLVIKVDLETTANGGPDGDSPEAHWQVNHVLLCGFDSSFNGYHVDYNVEPLCDMIQDNIELGREVIIVAHNAKFDLKYLMRDRPDVDWHKVRVHCTMTWEYRETGQLEKLISLEALADKYGIKFKKSLDLGAILASGIKMEDIPTGDLITYLEEDVRVLGDIYDKQGDTYDMDYILPLAEMELNGLHIDRPKAQFMMKDLITKVEADERQMMLHIKQQCEWQDGSPIIDEDFSDALGIKSKHIKPMAARTSSFLLTGEPVSLQITPKWVVKYKDGFTPYYNGKKPSVFKNATHLGYPVGEDVLGELTDWISVHVMRHRKNNKLLSTYVSPFVYASSVQGTIHPKLNTAVTGTGRLSSSAPNGQNIPPEGRELCIPRDEDSLMVELDFKQLEIIALACVSGCKALQYDVSHGVDVHYQSGKGVMGWKTVSDMEEKDRKIVKNVNFGAIYGGKAPGLSKQTGVDKNLIQNLIDSLYTQYPGIATWQKQVFEDVVDGMYPYKIENGEQKYASLYDDPFSGRKFTFVEHKSPVWLARKTGRKFSFSPMQTANYPIQGFAGGDIVMIALTYLWKLLSKWNHIKFVMTVHDSIILEVPKHWLQLVEQAMETACKDTVKHLNLPVQLDFDMTTGKHWS